MSRMRTRWLEWIAVPALLAGCGQAPAEQPGYAADSAWSTFWGAFFDELSGEPGAEALKPLARFEEEAGIRFDYPAVLRGSYDAQQREWRLWRGDFELQVQVRDSYDPAFARTLLELLQGTLHSERAAPAEAVETAQTVQWCGREVTALRMGMTFFGDSHEYLAFDLPLADGSSRLLLFDYLKQGGKRPRTAEAVLTAVSTSLTCTAPQQNRPEGAAGQEKYAKEYSNVKE
ncbi:hypothetical protein [Tahibacter harae]|uniref:Lipoprotein n=1 Tax=Tahibacter harae TaxID=2963937 RepID=A0ABT1QXW0_9GAMM|nr:hypothetical protein [Tahibacter harae]MCQ4167122.1 hypothetical protein [Tahibacter harae]